MIQGTTPVLTFEVNTTNIKELCIAFGQNGRTILEKHKDDCTLTEESIILKLSQQDTLTLREYVPLQWQLKILDTNDIAMSTLIGELEVLPSLCKEVLE